MLPLNKRRARLAGAVVLGVALLAAGASMVAQGADQPAAAPTPDTTLHSRVALAFHAFGNESFSPLIAYQVKSKSARADQNAASGAQAQLQPILLCAVVPGAPPATPPVAVFLLGTEFVDRMAHEQIGGRTIAEVEDAAVRFTDGTLLVEGPDCSGSSSASSSTATTSLEQQQSITQPPVNAPASAPTWRELSPNIAPTPWAPASAQPQLYGAPVPDQTQQQPIPPAGVPVSYPVYVPTPAPRGTI